MIFMGLTSIRVSCLDQRLIVTTAPVVASGGRNENAVEFAFCSLWDGFQKVASFWRDEDHVYSVLIEADRCVIPWEVLADEGEFFFSVYGVKGEITRTSHVVKYKVAKGAITDGTEVSDPTPEMYEQILAACQEVLNGLDARFAAVNDRIDEMGKSIETGTAHEHDASHITSGTLSVERGGTGASDAASARSNLGITPSNIGAASKAHTHGVSDLNGIIPVEQGGTGAEDAETARENLGINPEAIGAAHENHTHDVSDLVSGALPIENGGTGANDVDTARANLGVAAESHTHADTDIITPEWIYPELINGTTPGGVGSQLRYRKIGNHVHVVGTVQVKPPSANGSVALFVFPEGYRPIANAYKLVPVGGMRVARLYVNAGGNFFVEWAIEIDDGSRYTTENWIDCAFDFWID
jgi:hypothetical protein